MQPAGRKRLALLRQLAKMRHEDPIWSEGTMEWVTDGEANGIVAFTRTLGARKTLVAANLSATSVAFRPTGLSLKPDQRLSVDFGVSVASDGTVSFEPWGCMATAVNP